MRNPFLEYALARLELQLVSWTRRGFDTRSRDAGAVARRLTPGLRAGDILLLHDVTPHAPPARRWLLEVLPRVLEAARAAGLRPITLRAALD